MEYLNQILLSDEITWETALARFLISFFLGTLVGLERETHNQPAGLRTHILISIGSTMVMLISIFIPQTFTEFQNGDPGRIAAQVISGIGFLGAGAIMKFGANVRGLTTAASIWVMAAVGLAVGAGMYTVSLIGVTVVLFALTAMDLFEKTFFKERTLRRIELTVKKKHSKIQPVNDVLKRMDVHVSSVGFDRNVNEATDKLTFLVGVTRKMDIQQLVELLEQLPGTVSVSVEIIQ
ncbi:putative Mg2+ transporter-C (MgtC) family protein [Mariniphaga anaerophila]|uniref:Putative Mg2+ transporter-C (MgtC) family protein n=1 Tax=Mariniphaga anaerophila TaxID=1484053 RepID=A0A1M4VGT1_9BACT|nr:MgtC/SapB family protein [Mariniphaga anaerophila]SHE68148.1 putative Mg2+ transporter-C (MgtC) family protein [Mariniphaga anaerophila]